MLPQFGSKRKHESQPFSGWAEKKQPAGRDVWKNSGET